MRTSTALALLLAIASGCSGSSSRLRAFSALPHAEPLPSPRAPLEPLSVPWPEGSVGGESREAEDALLLGLRAAVIQQGLKSVGSTSLVLRVPLDGGLEAAFKPETRKHGSLWRSEVAAYRLSRALGLDNVPPSIPRAARLASLVASAGPGPALRKIEAQAIVQGEVVPGAMIAWIRGLRRLPLEREPLWTEWGDWLAQLPPPRTIAAESKLGMLAPQISTMVAFDHLTGNVDRWSGHNVLTDVTGTRLVFLDNNLAFLPAKLSPAHDRVRREALLRTEKFSRRLVAAVRALDRDMLVRAMGKDHLGAPLLTDAQIDACLARKAELLAHVDALVAIFGEQSVLAFD